MTPIGGWLVVCAGAMLVCAVPVTAQTEDDDGADVVAADSAPQPKKKGLFGKMKDAAGSKVAKTVAKTVACTMVPGGQVIAGAIDAADSKNAGEAAGSAANAAVGGTCMPGMAGMPGGDVGGAAGGAAAAGLGAGMPGGQDLVPGAVTAGGVPGAAMDLGAYQAMIGMGGMEGDEDGGFSGDMAECLGLSEKDYEAYVNPTGGEPRAPTEKELKRQAKIARKVDVRRHQACAMQQAGAVSRQPGDTEE